MRESREASMRLSGTDSLVTVATLGSEARPAGW